MRNPWQYSMYYTHMIFLIPYIWLVFFNLINNLSMCHVSLIAVQINPDSSDNVCIEDCYISTGDDLIVIKSGWDEYGISFARPSSNISIRHIVGEANSGAGIALGSEMSGGISNVRAEDICLFNSLYGIRIKTSPGRGGYVRHIHISNVIMTNVKTAIGITGRYGEHPDENYDPNALPVIDMITIEDVSGTVIKHAGTLEGIKGDNFNSICLSNVHLNVTSKHPWKCSYIEGFSNLVTPELCESLRNPYQSSVCYTANHFDCCNLVQAAWEVCWEIWHHANLVQALHTSRNNSDTCAYFVYLLTYCV